jgi:glycosyltransferase involved in cell wall biosynthesis
VQMYSKMKLPKLIRITTVPSSLRVLLRHQLKFMSEFYDVLAVSSPEKMLEEVSIHEGVRTASVHMTRSITPTRDLKALWQLYRLFKKEKPAIVHTHTPKAGLLGMMAGRLAGVPIRIHTVAGLPLMESKGIKKRILNNTERLTYMCATKVFPNSKNLAEYIHQNKFCKKNKLKVLGNGSSNGIDMDFFQCTPGIHMRADELGKRLALTENDFIFLFIGRLVRDKGIEELVEAFVQLKQNTPGIKLLLVGPFEQDLDPISAKTIETIGKDDAIIHEGFQQDIRPYLALSHVLAFPSYREGFPNVPMQAGCFDLPSIVTDINGCNEIIEHGKNGLIIPVKNTEALRVAMETLMNDRQLYKLLKENARRMISERYEQKRFWKLLLEEYQSELKQNEIV